jgi:hypothetical protein
VGKLVGEEGTARAAGVSVGKGFAPQLVLTQFNPPPALVPMKARCG